MKKYYNTEKRTFGVNTDADGNLLSCFHGKERSLTKVGGYPLSDKIHKFTTRFFKT